MPSPDRPPLEYHYAAGAPGARAARLYACARALEARGASSERVLQRALSRRYLVSVDREGRESASEERARAIREDVGEDVVSAMREGVR